MGKNDHYRPQSSTMLKSTHSTRFFMHCDYQSAYCPIQQIVSYAFRDKAFANTALTPELIWRLRVPDHLPSLPLQWKPEVLRTPLLRQVYRTEYGLELHPSLPMSYAATREGMRELGRDAKFEGDLTLYIHRRWTANEVNRKSETLYCKICKDHLASNMLSQGSSRARSGKGCSVSPVTRSLRGTTKTHLLNAIFKG